MSGRHRRDDGEGAAWVLAIVVVAFLVLYALTIGGV